MGFLFGHNSMWRTRDFLKIPPPPLPGAPGRRFPVRIGVFVRFLLCGGFGQGFRLGKELQGFWECVGKAAVIFFSVYYCEPVISR